MGIIDSKTYEQYKKIDYSFNIDEVDILHKIKEIKDEFIRKYCLKLYGELKHSLKKEIEKIGAKKDWFK